MSSEALDYVRTRAETAKRLGVSVRTLARMEKEGLLPRTQITERCCGYRDSVRAKDFTPAPINDPSPWDTPRLAARKAARR